MKLSTVYLAGMASAAEKKVPPRHPLQRLNRLVDMTGEILNSGAFGNKPQRWIDRWATKFSNNADQMDRAFNRCGFYDAEIQHGGPEGADDRKRRDIERYDPTNPCRGMKQLITGFSKWSDRYISQCSG